MRALIFLVALLIGQNGFAKAKSSVTRQISRGYFKMDSQGRTYFIERPGVIEPGIQVKFESAQAEKLVCKLENPRPPLQCPVQEISFVLDQEYGKLLMVKTRLVNADSPWHRLRVAEGIFGLRSPSSNK